MLVSWACVRTFDHKLVALTEKLLSALFVSRREKALQVIYGRVFLATETP